MMSSPFIKAKSSTKVVMLDVVISLIPAMTVAVYAFSIRAVVVLASSVLSCVITDIVLGYFFLEKRSAQPNGAAIITGLLLAFTLSPLTPWHAVVFGGFTAILFGKILWGGLGKNTFNPALVGREFMTAFFPVIINNGPMWDTTLFVENSSISIPGGWYNNQLKESMAVFLYSPSGALGEYSPAAIILGGVYLLFRNRISWHIPVAVLVTFLCASRILPAEGIRNFSSGGLLLGAVFMATDMPTSPTHKNGKLYFGAMLGIVISLMLFSSVNNVYLSYGILIMNGFCGSINSLFIPIAWGHQPVTGFTR